MSNDSWIDKAIEKQQRDMRDVPQYLLDAYAGDYPFTDSKLSEKPSNTATPPSTSEPLC